MSKTSMVMVTARGGVVNCHCMQMSLNCHEHAGFFSDD